MFSVRTSKILPFLAALLCAGALALSGFGCDKSQSSKDDQAEAESPKESASADSGASANEKKRSQLKSKMQDKQKMKPSGARKKQMPSKKGGDIEVTDEDLENFARVQIQMKEYAKSEGLADERPQGKKEKIKMMMKMKQKANSVMDDIGMDQRRYAQIGRKMRADTQLQQRLNKKIQELEGAEGEGGGSESEETRDGE